MKKGFKKFTAMLLAGLLACCCLTACGEDVVKVSADDPMSPSEIQNALKKASDYTVTVKIGDDYTWTLKKDDSVAWYHNEDNLGDGTYYDAAAQKTYKPSNSGYTEYDVVDGDTAAGFAYSAVQNQLNDIIDALFNDSNFVATNDGNYVANDAGLAALDCDSAKITISGMVYTIKIDWRIITIDFSDVTLTLPTVNE